MKMLVLAAVLAGAGLQDTPPTVPGTPPSQVGLGTSNAASGATASTAPESLLPEAAGHVIENPRWLRKPTAQEFADVFPQSALRSLKGGKATVRCDVAHTGLLTNCQVVSEAPTGWGFGAAAIRLSTKFKMSPRKVDGVPQTGGVVTLPIGFGIRN